MHRSQSQPHRVPSPPRRERTVRLHGHVLLGAVPANLPLGRRALLARRVDAPHLGRVVRSLERGHRPGDGGHAVDEFGPEDAVGVVEHALLQGHHNELRIGEVRADHATDVLRVAQVQRGVNLVQDVNRRRLEQQKREDERERQ